WGSEAKGNGVGGAGQGGEAAGCGRVAVAGSMSSFCPIAMDAGALGHSLSSPAAEDPRFPGLADFREQAGLLAAAGADLIALEMIDGQGYCPAPPQAPPATRLPRSPRLPPPPP